MYVHVHSKKLKMIWHIICNIFLFVKIDFSTKDILFQCLILISGRMYVVLAVCEKYTYLQTIICTHLVNPFYSYKR